MNAKTDPVLIGGASAFVGDSILGPLQLVDVPSMQYLVFDYLAEMTLSGFSQTRKGDPTLGYSTEFVEYVLPQIVHKCAQRRIRLVANAGGLNPAACAAAIQKLLDRQNLSLNVAHVVGDDCLPLLDEIRASGAIDFYTDSAMPEQLDSANVYLGAIPIARALALGADIVVTGRIVDSAASLGILIHEFGLKTNDYDRLASGSLVGHVLECGAQATGGIFTDWQRVPEWENIGYPYAVCERDGSFVLRKPHHTGGLIDPMAVKEQILYEVADPANYVLPDVVCDFTEVNVRVLDNDGVLVTGARGTIGPSTYKMTASYQDGYRCIAQLSVFGIDAVKKARRTCDALLARTSRMLGERGFSDFSKQSATVIGAEDGYGPHAEQSAVREAIARVAVTHQSKEALDIFSRESRAPGVSFAPGTTSGSALTLNSRPVVEPLHRLFTCLVEKRALPYPSIAMGGEHHEVSVPTSGAFPVPYLDKAASEQEDARPTDHEIDLQLIDIAHGRSGDKGDTSNVALFVRDPGDFEQFKSVVTVSKVRGHLGHLVKGSIKRFEVPGLCALNFVMDQALDGGGPSSLRTDPMGKGMAQMLLEMTVDWHRPSSKTG